jgi:hypothetical protein
LKIQVPLENGDIFSNPGSQCGFLRECKGILKKRQGLRPRISFIDVINQAASDCGRCFIMSQATPGVLRAYQTVECFEKR